MAIARYAAKLAKLYPEDPLEALFVDEVIDTVGDVTNGIPRNTDPETFKKQREEYAAGKLKTFFSYLAEKLESGPYVLGAQFTVADIALYGTLKYLRKGILDHVSADYDAQWPVFQRFIDTLESNATFAPYKL
jgi:glutathione S-transferase